MFLSELQVSLSGYKVFHQLISRHQHKTFFLDIQTWFPKTLIPNLWKITKDLTLSHDLILPELGNHQWKTLKLYIDYISITSHFSTPSFSKVYYTTCVGALSKAFFRVTDTKYQLFFIVGSFTTWRETKFYLIICYLIKLSINLSAIFWTWPVNFIFLYSLYLQYCQVPILLEWILIL